MKKVAATSPRSLPRKPHRSSPRKRRGQQPRTGLVAGLLIVEVLGLAVTAVVTVMVALGLSAHWLAGAGFLTSVLPFAVAVAALMAVAGVALSVWRRLRRWLVRQLLPLPSLVASGLAVVAVWFVCHDGYAPVFNDFRALVGGKQQAARTTLAHQVYAAYRRYEAPQLQAMIKRAEAFNPAIQEAAQAFAIDVNLLQGVAAAESSFLPRDSHDGGHGLFQITAVPNSLLQQVARKLAVAKPDLANPRHNAFVAAATLKHYLADMNGDLFLGLLAYNIGPRNGGLRFIMQQYGASDFITMQPYLQQLPRDYPIRVLSYALAFKLWQLDGKLSAYEDGDNAARIQRLGIPGLAPVF